jgi:tetratricopeptide (TPR) repeat protein
MHLVAPVLFLLLAGLGTSYLAAAADPTQSMTVLGPSNPDLASGATALQEGRIEEGIRLTLSGLKAPGDARDRAAGYANLCAGYALLKQWDEALKHCNAALALDQTNWRVFNNRAAVMVGKGEYDLAIVDLRSGLELAPNSHTLQESLRIVQQNKRLASIRSRSAIRP